MPEGSISINVTKKFPLRALKRGFAAATEFALRRVADRLLSDSRQFVPVLTGALKDSGFIEAMPSVDLAFLMVRVIYPLDYAEVQHEEDFRHPSLGFAGPALYLQKPLDLFTDFYFALFAFEFDEFVEKNGLT